MANLEEQSWQEVDGEVRTPDLGPVVTPQQLHINDWELRQEHPELIPGPADTLPTGNTGTADVLDISADPDKAKREEAKRRGSHPASRQVGRVVVDSAEIGPEAARAKLRAAVPQRPEPSTQTSARGEIFRANDKEFWKKQGRRS